MPGSLPTFWLMALAQLVHVMPVTGKTEVFIFINFTSL